MIALGLFRYALHRADLTVEQLLLGEHPYSRSARNPRAGSTGFSSARRGSFPPSAPGEQAPAGAS